MAARVVLLVGMLQVFSEKTATSLKDEAMLAYPVYVELLNMLASFRRFHNGHGYAIVGFLQVINEVENTSDSGGLPSKNDTEKISGESSVLDMCDYAALTSTSKGRVQYKKMALLHATLRELLNGLGHPEPGLHRFAP